MSYLCKNCLHINLHELEQQDIYIIEEWEETERHLDDDCYQGRVNMTSINACKSLTLNLLLAFESHCSSSYSSSVDFPPFLPSPSSPCLSLLLLLHSFTLFSLVQMYKKKIEAIFQGNVSYSKQQS